MEDRIIRSSRISLSDQFSCTGADPFLLEWLEAYSEKKPTPLLLSAGSPFQKKVMEALAEIPFGKTVSYQQLAKTCGAPKGARAIGNACGKNPFPLLIPCHRVLRADGKLGGFSCGLEIKKRLLEFEAG